MYALLTALQMLPNGKVCIALKHFSFARCINYRYSLRYLKMTLRVFILYTVALVVTYRKSENICLEFLKLGRKPLPGSSINTLI